MKFSKKEIIIGISIILFISLILIIVLLNPIKLKKDNIKLNYKTSYKEPGFEAKKYFQDYTKDVKVEGKVNPKKIGKYKLTYIVKILGITYKKVRIVEVVDDEKPKIILKGDKNTNVCPNKEYEEEGYTVTDNYDKNLKDKVKIKKEKDKIVYTVKDSAGNLGKATRYLTYQDKDKPEITLNGNSTMTIIVGNKYNELSAKATDKCDGDISNEINISGTVNTEKTGTYELIYKVKDKSGNEAETKRTVVVKQVSVYNDGRPGTIYLTFDDGPKDGTTNVILDVLKEEGVKATFFVTNHGPDYLIKREYNEGHTVALHTATHNYATVYASDQAYYNDLYSVQDRVKRLTGYTSTIIRFPGGSSNTVSRKYSPGIMTRLTQSVLDKGFKYYDWNISSGDAGGTTTSSGVYNNVIRGLRKDRANMVLMHDIKTYTRDAIRNIIRYGKQAGYTFERITMNTAMIRQGVNN